MPTPSLKFTEFSPRVLEMRSRGISRDQIALDLGISQGSVSKILRLHSKTLPPIPTPLPGDKLDPSRINSPVDDRGPNSGETHIVTPDKPLTLGEITTLFKINTDEWEATSIRTNQWQGFYKLPKAEGSGHRKVALWQTRVSWKRIVNNNLQAALSRLTSRLIKPAPQIKLKKTKSGEPFAVSWGLWDTHLGMLAWADEVGESYDLRIAKDRILRSVDQMLEELRPYNIQTIWMPVGNDFMHFDNIRQHTTGGDHHLDSDGRYGRVYEVAIESLCYLVERAATITPHLDIFYIPGNHDLLSSYTLCHVLAQRYRHTKSITVDTSPNPRKYRTFGKTLVGFDHGDTANPQQLALALSRDKDNLPGGPFTYLEMQTGHYHQRREREIPTLTPTNGVTIWTNPSLSSIDAWHHKHTFLGEPRKSVEARRYDHVGYRGSHVAWIEGTPPGDPKEKSPEPNILLPLPPSFRR